MNITNLNSIEGFEITLSVIPNGLRDLKLSDALLFTISALLQSTPSERWVCPDLARETGLEELKRFTRRKNGCACKPFEIPNLFIPS